MGGDNLQKGSVDVFGHAFGIAADVKVGSTIEPAPEFGPLLEHAVLDVDFLGLITREGGGEFVEVTGFLGLGEFIAVKKIATGALVTKEEPIFPWMGVVLAVLEEGAEGSDASAGSDHDHVALGGRQMEVASGLDKNRNG
jgi:hypothetical protein